MSVPSFARYFLLFRFKGYMKHSSSCAHGHSPRSRHTESLSFFLSLSLSSLSRARARARSLSLPPKNACPHKHGKSPPQVADFCHFLLSHPYSCDNSHLRASRESESVRERYERERERERERWNARI